MNTFTLTDYLNAREFLRFEGYNPYENQPRFHGEMSLQRYIRERGELGPLNEFDANGAIVRGGM